MDNGQHWYEICDRTGGTITIGVASRQHHIEPKGCRCGATTHIEWNNERQANEGCPIAQTVFRAQGQIKSAIRQLMDDYRRQMRKLTDEWDLYDSDGFWIGEDEEPDYPLNIPNVPATKDVQAAAGVLNVSEC